MTLHDITYCTDEKCLNEECHRHPVHWKKYMGVEDTYISLSAFTLCEERVVWVKEER